jgi:hypothetical protein
MNQQCLDIPKLLDALELPNAKLGSEHSTSFVSSTLATEGEKAAGSVSQPSRRP